MIILPSILSLVHLLGLVLGVGAASVKLLLLFRCKPDPVSVSVYLSVVRPITRLIILGLVLLTLSGIGWLLVDYPLTPLLIVKLILVATIWALGPIIDNAVEPGFRRLAPASGEAASTEFMRILERYRNLELVATSLFYVIIVVWVLL